MKRWAALLLVCLAAHEASAQISSGQRSFRTPSAPSTQVTPTLKHRLGIEVAETLLLSQNSEDRERGFERLGSIGTAQALDLLLKAFETGGSAHSAKDRLIAVRALAPHASVPAARDFLVRIMVGVGSNPERPEAVDGMIEHAAALALAASGDDGALSALGKALRQPGHVAETARDALLAFPPQNLAPVVQDLRSPTRTFASLLGELGDARAIPALRELVRGAPIEVRPEAAVALAELGVSETIELGRHWLEHESGADFQIAATRILLHFHTPDAATAVGRLLLEQSSHAVGVELASSASLPALSATLLQQARSASDEERSALFSALALSGTREAISFLGGALSTRASSSAAALSLALSPEAQAESVLEQALRVASTRRAAVRASIARKLALDRVPSGLDAALQVLAQSRDESDRALYFQASAVLDPGRTTLLLKRASKPEVRALARAALVPGVARALAERLAAEPDPALREALAVCLVSSEAAERVPSDVLLQLIDARGLAAPLAARALGSRDSRALRPKITSLLASSDSLLRSHVALGLGQSEDNSALGILERAYRFETNAGVRLAIVHALAARREPARLRPLSLARTLDGSAQVREAAALGLAGAHPSNNGSGPQTAWLDFSHEPDAEVGPAPALGTLVITAGGLALPVFADPDGVLLLPALPAGPIELRLAAPARTDDALRPRHP
ncbi:MAG TPA: HEAT repeat domain-containing protein [Polyangiaceae bacterium]